MWGDPIAHSKSPALHAAAYRVLGLDWEYDRRRVNADDLPAAVAGLDSSWRGLSLTMPLKEQAFRAASVRDRHATLTRAVNTLLLDGRPAGFNTDVGGIVDALADDGMRAATSVRILGAGATAASALVAAAEIGAERAEIRARRPDRAAALADLGDSLGVTVSVTSFDATPTPMDLTIATLPSGTSLPADVSVPLAADGGVLFDAAYAPWPSALAAVWNDAPVVSGLGMLLHQAIRQIRVFLHGDPAHALDDEASVLAAMRAAL
ncbi:shikimate dehydrogenase family protein [Microbacterium sp. NPDC090003]|uniref:shikimate dehydrogenase family protein n=1 Tax=Microbacterium sp. NPDC090003 TaxID=3364203 RepID=UPI0037F78FA9